MGRDALVLLPEGILLAGLLGCLLGGSFTPRLQQGRIRAAAALTVVTASAATVMDWAAHPAARTLFEATFVVDDTTRIARLVVSGAVLLIVMMAGADVAGSARESETYVLLLLMALGVQVLTGATDLLLLITGYLLASIPLYAILGLGGTKKSAEAALKTYLLGALLGIVLMSGVTTLYGVTGTTAYHDLDESLAGAPAGAVAFGAVAVLAGLLFKAGAVPAHFWVPDAAEGARVTAATAATTIPKIGAAVALYRFAEIMPGHLEWSVVIAVVATLTMTLGNLAAFAQTDARRLLGWSTVSQIGYILVAVAVAGRADLALPSLLMYLAAYSATNVAVFAVTAALPQRRALSDYRGVARQHPILSTALVVGLLGLVGTPPTGVFVGKLTVATAAWDGGLAWLTVVVMINSVASLFYYLRWLAPLFAKVEDADASTGRETADPYASLAAVAAAVISLGLGLGAAALIG